MMLKDVVVARESVDVGQTGAFGQKVPDGDLVRSVNAWNESAYVVIELDCTCVDKTQNSRGRELHRHGSNVEARGQSVRYMVLSIGKAVGFFEEDFSVLLDENISCKVFSVDVLLNIGVQCSVSGAVLRRGDAGTDDEAYNKNYLLQRHRRRTLTLDSSS